ncbi:MAG: hypothetical protein AABX13_05250 [Nanoarchaeota archaeon]
MSDGNRDGNGTGDDNGTRTSTPFQEEEAREEGIQRYYKNRDLADRVRNTMGIYEQFKDNGDKVQQERVAGLLLPKVQEYLAAKFPVEDLVERCQGLLPELTALVPAPPAPTVITPSPVPSPAPGARPAIVRAPALRTSPEPSVPPQPDRVLLNPDSYLRLENIVCVDADGNEFERYGELYVRKDIFRNQPGQTQKSFASYKAVVHCEQNGLFLPSFALSCNILQALYQRRSDTEIKTVLDQYKDKGNDIGYHAQNSLVDFARQQVIHYPTAADFDETAAVNASRQRKTAAFDSSALQNELLESALRKAAPARYVKQLTGLRDPQILVEMGQYFGRPAKLWFAWMELNSARFTEKRAAWLGCSSSYLNLDAYLNLDHYGAARGVSLEAPVGGAT